MSKKPAPPRILVVDDDSSARNAVIRVLDREGYVLQAAESASVALKLIDESSPDVVLTDIRMDRLSGIDLLRRVRREWPSIPVLVMTAFAGVDTAVSSIQEGAFDYISKPYEIDELRSAVRRAVEHTRIARTDLETSEGDAPTKGIEIVGSSPPMVAVYKKIALLARSDATVLIEGETGSGKELVARAIHQNSRRAHFPFVAANCGAFTETLLETELFGHVRGAFTGAVGLTRGLFESANRGTVFLDEIGETSPAMQLRLLRVLEEREIQRIGSPEALPVDIRVIAATNRDLGALIVDGAFREDLYYRLNVVTIEVPPLRDRRSDIPLLFDRFLKLCGRGQGAPMAVHPSVLEMLTQHDWPGNVRELENSVERAVALNTTGVLTPEDFAPELRREERRASTFPSELVPLSEIERQYVEHVIQRVGGNMSQAADVLGIDRRTLYRMRDRFKGVATGETGEDQTH